MFSICAWVKEGIARWVSVYLCQSLNAKANHPSLLDVPLIPTQTLNIYISACRSLTWWHFGHTFINFSQQSDCPEGLFFRCKMYLCPLQNPWKYEVIWGRCLKIIIKIHGVTRWRKNDKKLRIIWSFFISLRMYAVFKETFYGDFVANSLRYPIEK